MYVSSTMRVLIPLALAALLTLMPTSAQEETTCPEGQTETPEGCSQQAWVDDCPPDMMCAAGAPEEPVDDGPTYGDCDGEVCAYDTPADDGTDQATPPPFSTCMDGVDEGEDCDDDSLVYLTGPQGQAEGQAGDGSDADGKDAPAAPVAFAAVLFLGLVALVAAFRRV